MIPNRREEERQPREARPEGSPSPPEYVRVARADLIAEHDNLLARIHVLRRQLGFPPLLTGKKRRELDHPTPR